jgi:hypothetical protein
VPSKIKGGRPGRPLNGYACSTVTTYLRDVEHDRLIAMAKRREVSVSKLLRQMVRRQLEAAETPKTPSK